MPPTSLRERYPPPWRIDAIPGGFRVVSNNGYVLAWVYALEGQARAASPDKLLPREALAMAKAIVSLVDESDT
jgi:hypothetical protein